MRLCVLALMWVCAAPLIAAGPLEIAEPTKQPHLKSIYSTLLTPRQFLKRDGHGIVFVFLGTKCPVARQYVPRLNELARQYSKQNVSIVGVYSDAGVSVLEMATHAHDEDICFPVFIDVEQRLATLLGVTTVPEVVVLDRNLERVYQGAIDDQFTRHGRRVAATENYLEDALKSLVEGHSPRQPYVAASGCPLERREPARTARAATFHKDVAPIVQKNCQPCHRTGGVAPFELLSYGDVAYNAAKIREVVKDRRMPPWHGILHADFGNLANDKRLSDDDLEILVDWIDAGTPEGDRAAAPPPIRWPRPDEWEIGTPDFVYRMPRPFVVPKSGALEYQFFRVRMDLPEDRWFRAVEIKPGNPEVVHHITLHLAPASSDQKFGGLAAMAFLYGLNGERAHLINDFLPGDTYNAKTYPSDQAVLIPKHSDLIFEVHYTPSGRAAAADQSMVGFRWADAPPQQRVHTIVYRKPVGGFRIPPHNPHFRMEDTFYFRHDVLIDAIRPHFHWRGKSYRLEIIKRNAESDEITERRTILTVPIFDQAWQRTYELATPLLLEAGTELLATGHFDNSWLNPNNPDPSAEVVWGQQTSDEMFSTRFKYRLASEVTRP